MFKSFQEIEHAVLDSAKRARIALAGAHDLDALSSLVRAREAGIAHGILIGRTEQVREILKRLGQLETDWELIEVIRLYNVHKLNFALDIILSCRQLQQSVNVHR